MNNLLNILRQETSKLHHTLHEHPLLQSCQNGSIGRKEYIHFLTAFYSPWEMLIPAITSVPIKSLRPKLLRRAEAIHNDLVNLKTDLNTLESIPQKQDFSEDELLGICYVLVGSSMGASMLSTNIKASLGEEIPMSYLSMSPKEAGWPELAAKLRTLESKDYSLASIAALNTFKLIQTKLTR